MERTRYLAGLRKGVALLAAVFFIFPLPGQAADLTLGGSGADLETMRRLADAFEKANPGTMCEVLPSLGSGGGVKDIAITCELLDYLPLLRADGRKVKQIVINLLSNAIKFTDPGGEVTLKAWFRPLSGFVLQVTDTGIGIALEDIPLALEPFKQVDSGLSRKYDGTGLGLPLTKSLVEIHGGSFDLQSKLGAGTTVTVRFPAERIIHSLTHVTDTTSAASAGSGG